MTQKGNAAFIIFILVLVIGIAGSYLAYYFFKDQIIGKPINSFEECIKAGFPARETDPPQCWTPDGKYFVQVLSEQQKQKLTPSFDSKSGSSKICAQVITLARDSSMGECKEFSTPCDVPEGWEKVESCGDTLEKKVADL